MGEQHAAHGLNKTCEILWSDHAKATMGRTYGKLIVKLIILDGPQMML